MRLNRMGIKGPDLNYLKGYISSEKASAAVIAIGSVLLAVGVGLAAFNLMLGQKSGKLDERVVQNLLILLK